LPNLNAALACAQMGMLDEFISKKRELASAYQQFFLDKPEFHFYVEPKKVDQIIGLMLY
jgi:dTDP-4-amino-4,6-dideoxygalactose transaminase